MRPLRLLLIDPPFYRLYKDGYGLRKVPLGCASLAASALRLPFVEVLVQNADFHPDPEPFSIPYLAGEGYAALRNALDEKAHPAFDALEAAAAAYRPDVVGLSVRTPALASALITARRIRRVAPRAVILAGGPHPGAVRQAVLAHPEFDAAVLGEGEAALADCLTALGRGLPLDGLAGTLTRRDGRIVVGPTRTPLGDLDALPFPGELPLDRLVDGPRYPAAAFGFVFASRGCPRRCAYCATGAVWGRRVRHRSNPSVLAELALLAARGVTHVHFDDDTFGGTKRRLLALCRDVERAGIGLSLSCETHVNLIDEETVAALARAGFITVQLGLESGDDAMLARVGKGFDALRARRAAELVKAAGLRLEAFFMVGFPDETEESLAATRRLMEELPCDKLIYSVFTPYPGTPLFEVCRQRGLIGPDFDPSRHNHQSPENAFCPAIPPERFHRLAERVEALAARRNAGGRAAGGSMTGGCLRRPKG